MDDKAENINSHKNNCSSRSLHFLKCSSFFLLCNFLLSQWGDLMWQFAVGIYLVELSNGCLRLTAIFGFLGGGLIFLSGGLIGFWIDRNSSLYVARVSLIIQNLSVAASALFVCILFVKSSYLMPGTYGRIVIEVCIVGFAILARLFSVTYKIEVERDWIFKIAEGNSPLLSYINAATHFLDHICKICCPIVVGFIMSYSSLVTSAIIIAIWNVISVFIEYTLLLLIYRLVPKLSNKTKCSDQNEMEHKKQNIKSKIFYPFISLKESWKKYVMQQILFAGISLACLNAVVLNFDSITLGYIYLNGISESWIGFFKSLYILMGLLGVILFTQLTKLLGLKLTGMIAFYYGIICLVTTIVAVWKPGSPFDRAFFTENKNSKTFVIEEELIEFVLKESNSTKISRKLIPASFSESDTLLIFGLITSSLGVWIVELVVTQLMQEYVIEKEHGVLIGVQNSLQIFMEILKFFLLILLPEIESFGYHIILSNLFIWVGGICYTYYYFKNINSIKKM